MKDGRILVSPACERGRGGGHLSRSFYLVKNLREKGREAFLWIPEDHKDDVMRRFSFLAEVNDAYILSRREELESHTWDFIVLDRFKTPAKEFALWTALPGRGSVPLIGIDEGGPCRNRFDFLIDLLPSLSEHEPNFSAPGLLPLPKNRKSENVFRNIESDTIRILISFGAEDSANLGILIAKALSSYSSSLINHSSLSKITLIIPNTNNFNELNQKLPGIYIIGNVTNLKEHLTEYDLFITHFGLGAFEAIYAKIPVLLVSPTAYHEKLAQNAGFFTITAGKKIQGYLQVKSQNGVSHHILNRKFLEKLQNNCEDIARRFGLEDDQKEDLASFIGNLAPNSVRSCPLCEGKTGPVLVRFPGETYRRCPHCGTMYQSRLNPPPIEYEKEYFFDSYKKQYGRTYLEDFPNLKEMGRKRLTHIQAILNSPFRGKGGVSIEKPSVLDIGCAYGPFLAAAAECGFSPYGIEPAKDAVRYVNEALGFTAWRGFFPEAMPKGSPPAENIPDSFNAITLWYVIEHFQDPGKILREIHRLLKDGGVLALSTPSFSGISGRKSLLSFLNNSPPDHFTIWSPGLCGKIFKKYGFRLLKIKVTGHHPERFPLLGRFARPDNIGLLYQLLLFVSRLFGLGDTFEVYGVKIKNNKHEPNQQ